MVINSLSVVNLNHRAHSRGKGVTNTNDLLDEDGFNQTQSPQGVQEMDL